MSEIDDIVAENDDKKMKLKEDILHYRKCLSYLSANVPIEVLCLPKVIENALIAEGKVRVYDLFECDLTKIKGLGKNRVELLTARLDEFFSFSI